MPATLDSNQCDRRKKTRQYNSKCGRENCKPVLPIFVESVLQKDGCSGESGESENQERKERGPHLFWKESPNESANRMKNASTGSVAVFLSCDRTICLSLFASFAFSQSSVLLNFRCLLLLSFVYAILSHFLSFCLLFWLLAFFSRF